MARGSDAPSALMRRRRRRAHAVPLAHRIPHRFLLSLLSATARKAARHRAPPKSTSGVAGRREPKRPDPAAAAAAADETQEERGIEARDTDGAAVAGKYWAHRHSLFSLYDRGVRMDAEGWYSATPEAIAASQAAHAAPGDLVVDAFAGVGGNSIQFAARGCFVVAVEIDPRKVELAKHNAKVYGVQDRIEFVVGDFFRLAPFLKADVVFLSPSWGGPSYIQAPVYTLDMLQPKDGKPTTPPLRSYALATIPGLARLRPSRRRPSASAPARRPSAAPPPSARLPSARPPPVDLRVGDPGRRRNHSAPPQTSDAAVGPPSTVESRGMEPTVACRRPFRKQCPSFCCRRRPCG